MAWCDMALYSMAWRSSACHRRCFNVHVVVRHCNAWNGGCGEVMHGEAWQGRVGWGVMWRCKVRCAGMGRDRMGWNWMGWDGTG